MAAAMAEAGAVLSPGEPKVFEIPVIVIELSDDDFFEWEDEQTALDGNSPCPAKAEGTGPLEMGCNATNKGPRKSSELSEETCLHNKPEDYPNAADENEQSSVTGSCLPGDFPEDAESLRRESYANPEPGVSGNHVPPKVTDCPERHDVQENMLDANENAESGQQSLKELSRQCSQHNSRAAKTSTKKQAETIHAWKCLHCHFKGKSSVHLQKHIWTTHKNKNNRQVIQRSSCHKCKKKTKAVKKGKINRSDPGQARKEKAKAVVKRKKKKKSKYEKFFSKMKKVPKPSKSFRCKTCSFVLSDPEGFLDHVKEHSNGPPYQCPRCEYSSDDSSYFLNHLFWHIGCLLYKCNFCGYFSRHFANVVKHSYLHTGARPYLCAVCQIGFTSASGLNRHIGTHWRKQENNSVSVAREENLHSPKNYVCEKCGIVFYTLALLEVHMKHHLHTQGCDAPLVTVKKCKTQSAESEQVNGSEEEETSCPDKSVWEKSERFQCMYSCDQCGLALHKEEHLVYHKAVHLQVQAGENRTDKNTGGRTPLKLFKCLQCAYTTSRFSSLLIHSATHTGESPFKCQVCDKSFRSFSHLNRHSWLHKRNGQKCSRCSFIGSSLEDLKLHEETCKDKGPMRKRLRPSGSKHKSPKEQINVVVADGSTPSQGTSNRFQRPYNCNRCGLVLRKEEHLVYHKAVHLQVQAEGNRTNKGQKSGGQKTGSSEASPLCGPPLKLFKCLQCAYTTSLFSSLRVHFATHTGEKPFKCQVCDKSFRNSSHLNRHSRLHKRNSHKCSRCPFIGSSPEDLNLHEKTCKDKGPTSKRLHPSPLRHENPKEQINVGEANGSISSQGTSDRFQRTYSCNQCGLVLHKEEHLVYHKAVHLQVQAGGNRTSKGQESGGQKTGSSEASPLCGPPLKLFKCLQCAYTTSLFSSLRVHFATHTGEKPFKCQVCDKSFRNSSHLKRHSWLHKRNSHKCSRCPFIGSSPEDLNLHEKTCKDKGPTSKRLRSSPLRHESPKEQLNMGEADGSISSQGTSDRFQRTYSCNQCGLALHKEEYLVYHKAAHLQVQAGKKRTGKGQESGVQNTELSEASPPCGPPLKLFKCLQCAYMTSSFSSLRVHFATHTGEKPFKCQVCDKSFRNSSHLNRHSQMHERNCHKCSWCPFIGSSPEDLKLHEETCKDKGPASKRLRSSPLRHESPKEQINMGEANRSTLYTCKVCQKKYQNSSLLKRHSLVHQKLEFKCSSCKYLTSTWQSFKRHMASHEKAPLPNGSQRQEKPTASPAPIYKCEKCSYATPRKENLTVHFRIHTGEKPYKCPHCGYPFRTSSHLNRHLSTHVMLQCDKCDFSTVDERVLQKHVRTHKKEELPADKKVYKCNKCRLTFSILRVFKVHKEKHKESE
ncbi:zinc finger protein 107-like [Eublepharis macularius]|uniref:Zinc finger protein 107-like n=1 Tax=Eublepharis macularius TaxID=481883 RepID=A0AA97JSJ9_EUBMA|nr:zinc finger protein 107-like [Eublepharis macularius]